MKKILYTLVVGAVLALAGCFDIKDEVFLDEKGSGSFQSTFDMSGMKDMLGMLKTMMPDSLKNTEEGKKLDDENLADSIMSMWKDLEKIPGISQVKREKKGDMIFSISFRFADVKALNAAMAARSRQDSGGSGPKGDFFQYSKGSFACIDTTMSALGEAMNGFKGSGDDQDTTAVNLSMFKALMGDMKYTHIYHLPGKVQSVSNKLAKISEDGKTVTLELDLTSEDKAQSLQNIVKFRQ